MEWGGQMHTEGEEVVLTFREAPEGHDHPAGNIIHDLCSEWEYQSTDIDSSWHDA